MWRERQRLIEMWRSGQSAALATLVAVDGSSYRRPGARILVATDGDFVGSISGGCLEAEIARKARWMVRDGAVVQRYSTALDDSSDIPYGLGCGGTVHVLVEPASTPEFEQLMRAMNASLHGESFTVATVLPGEGRLLSRTVRSGSETLATSFEAGSYLEHLAPPQRIVICGAGNDAQPLARLAGFLGWRVAVLDGRAQWARPERFPEAETVLQLNPADGVAQHIRPDDFAVVMTHSFDADRDWLQALLPQRLPYLGLLGAHHRSARLAADVAALLGWSLGEVCSGLRAPVGLDLGGDGAEAIALSVIAEMQACAAGKSSASRRMNVEALTEQMARADREAFVPVSCPV